MRRRLFAIIMALTMVISIFPATAMAEEVSGETIPTLEENQIPNENSGDNQNGISNGQGPLTESPVGTESDTNSTPEEEAPTETDEEAAFLDAVEQGGTVTLTDDLTLTHGLTISKDNRVVLDLNEHTLTLSGTVTVQDKAYETDSMAGIANEGTLTIKNGTVTSSAVMCLIINSGELTLEDDVDLTKSGAGNAIDNLGGTVVSDADITLSDTGYTAIVTYGGRVTINGGEIKADTGVSVFNRWYNNASAGAEVVVNGGSIQSKIFALSTNNIRSGGSEPSNVTIKGGNLTSTNATVVYWPSAGTLEIGSVGGNDNAVQITAENGSAIEVCSGTLIVNSGTLRGSDSSDALNASVFLAGAYRGNSGCAGVGDAVTIIARRGAGYDTAPLNVAINGGNFTSSDNYAVRYFDCNEASGAAQITQDVSVSIFGGTFNFTGTTGGSAVDAEVVPASDQAFITGGAFSSKVPDAYMPAGYACVEEDGIYVVDEAQNGAMVVKPETGDSGEVSATLDGIYKGENTTITGGATGEGESTPTGGNVSIDLSSAEGGGDSNTSASLTVTQTAAASLADNGANSLTVQTDVGSVKLDSAALDKVGDAQSDVVISIEKDKTSVASSTASYTVEVKSGDNNLLPEGESGNGEITITIPYPQRINSQENLFVYYIKNSIAYQRMNATKTDDGQIIFTTNHLSQYAVYDAEPSTGYEAAVTNVAGVSTPYETLVAAINVAQDGDTVTLMKSTDLTVPVTIDNYITFNLGGNTLTLKRNTDSTSALGLDFTSEGDSVLRNGTIIDGRSKGTQNCGFIAVRLTGDGTLTTENLTVKTYQPDSEANYNYLLRVDGGTGTLTLKTGTVLEEVKQDNPISEITYGAIGVAVFGTQTTNTTEFDSTTNLVIEDDVRITTTGFAISGNGSNSNGTNITIHGGEITSLSAQGIYHPQYGTLTIDGGTVTGVTGIEMRSGELNVSGDAVIVGTGEPITSDPNGNGSTTSGAGIAVVQHTTKLPITVEITGGEIRGYNALYQENTQDNEDTAVEKITLVVEGGDFLATGDDGVAAYSENKQDFISGGNFSDPVDEQYLDNSLNAELYSIRRNPEAPYSYYPSVDEALEAAGSGDQITDLSDQSDDSPEPVQVVTVTYDNGGHGTAPAGCKVLAGATITLENMSDADGYLFAGWSDGDTTYQSGAEVTVNMNTTFTAVWKVVAKPTAVRYIVEHYLEGRWGYELEDTEFFTGKIGDTVTAQPKDYPGYRYNERISTASGTLIVIEDEGDIVTLKLYYDERTTSRPSGGSSEPSYTVSVEDLVNGTVETDPRRAQEGEEVTITVTPDDGYELDTLTVIDRDGDEVEVTEERDGTFTFEMPDSRVTIEATFVPVAEDIAPEIPTDWSNPYGDVAANAWYYDAVAYVTANGLMNGTSATTFAPDATTTRAMIWTVLARMNGQNVDGGTPWYAMAQSWAMTANVSDGTNPGNPISREELATMLYRAAGSPDVSGNLLSYSDGSSVSAWAESAMLWATQNGIISGIDGMLTPQGQATRAQVATMLMRFREVVIH